MSIRPPRDAVQGGERLREHGCRAERLAEDERAEADALELARQRGQRDDRFERGLGPAGPPYLAMSRNRWSETQTESKPTVSAVACGLEDSRPGERSFVDDGVVVLRQRQSEPHGGELYGQDAGAAPAPGPDRECSGPGCGAGARS